MASAAEQLAANFSFNSFAKADVLKKRLWFTLAALIVYRFGTYLPLPGIDTQIMLKLAQQNSTGILGIFDKFSGGALGRMTIFALGVMPYISASIITQLMTAVSPQLEALKKEGETGRKKLNQYTRYLTVLLAVVQSWGIINGLINLPITPVIESGLLFKISGITTLTSGTLFLMWLGEQITARGIGNGVSLLIFSGIVANLPHAIGITLELGRSGAMSTLFIFMLLVIIVATIIFIVYMERAQRRIFIQYPKRQIGTSRQVGGESSHLPLKLNSAGVIPPIFASSLLMIPTTIANFTGSQEGFFSTIMLYMAPGKFLYVLLSITLILFFSFFYTSVVFNPTETADNLKKGGAIVPGYRPGSNTAQHLDYVLTRLTVVGAIYLAAICVLPEIAIAKYAIPYALGGTSLLIVVGVSIDTVTQIQSHMLAHQYENLMKKVNNKAMPL